jgi:uncharacterized protein
MPNSPQVGLIERIEQDSIRGFLHHPKAPNGAGLVVTHGAGGDCTSSLLVGVAEAFSGAGLCVLRCDLAFRQRRPKGPPSPSGAAADRESLQAAIAYLKRKAAKRLYLGGQSYGGRQASLLAAEHPRLADGLVLLSYPLHPPGKPTQLRTAHFPMLRTPTLFVSGTADPFGSTAELEEAIEAIPARTRLLIIDGAGHDLKRGRFDLGPVVAALLD